MSLEKKVKSVLEETNAAYDICSYAHLNADYAEFASMSLIEFKDALRNPDLTARQLRRALRDGDSEHRQVSPKSCWATFMASYVSKAVNRNGYKRSVSV